MAVGGRTDEEQEHKECRLEVEESSLKLLGVSESEVNDGQSFDLSHFFLYIPSLRSVNKSAVVLQQCVRDHCQFLLTRATWMS